jgi:hypothetical protein
LMKDWLLNSENIILSLIKKLHPTMCIVHSTIRDATTPYTKRWATLK